MLKERLPLQKNRTSDPFEPPTFFFATNRFQGSASKLPHEGFERPSHCQFGPDGAFYEVDFGIIHIAPKAGGIRQQVGSGTLWRIHRIDGPRGELPPKSKNVPVYPLQLLGGLIAITSLSLLIWWNRR